MLLGQKHFFQGKTGFLRKTKFFFQIFLFFLVSKVRMGFGIGVAVKTSSKPRLRASPGTTKKPENRKSIFSTRITAPRPKTFFPTKILLFATKKNQIFFVFCVPKVMVGFWFSRSGYGADLERNGVTFWHFRFFWISGQERKKKIWQNFSKLKKNPFFYQRNGFWPRSSYSGRTDRFA